MKLIYTFLATALTTLCAYSADPIDPKIDLSTRSDGRHTSSLALVRSLMRTEAPACTFNPSMTPAEFPQWQNKMSEAMARIMRHPDYRPEPPRKVACSQRNGYRIERWETYPLPNSVVAVYLLLPDGVDASHPARGAALCIPGFGQTKELLAGEAVGNFDLTTPQPEGETPLPAMARLFAENGIIAVAVDNVSAGELSDHGRFDYVNTSRYLLELGWSYLGLTSWQDRVVLDWMKTLPEVPADRIIVSGFSLGTEPLMVLGLLDPSIHAFIYNDFLCRTRERILAMTAPDANGNRPFPNNIEHLIPEFLTEFDFPDIVAALAPRPVICTEGGLDRDFHLIERAYDLAGAPEGTFEYHHYAKFVPDSMRQAVEEVPAGINRDTFFRICNVDPPRHYFKREHILPWLDRILPSPSAD